MPPALKLVLLPLILRQATTTRQRTPVLPEAAGPRRGVVGAGATAFRLLIAGDSSAAGVGVAHQDQAFAGYLTRSLHQRLHKPIDWTLVARTGATTRDLHALLLAQPPLRADVAVVVSGVNDVIEQIPAKRAVEDRAALADWLFECSGVRQVVFAPLPPMQRFPLLPQPLKLVVGVEARGHDLALARWAAARSGVSHVHIETHISRETMAADGFHPGEPVYRDCGEAVAAHIEHLQQETVT